MVVPRRKAETDRSRGRARFVLVIVLRDSLDIVTSLRTMVTRRLVK